VSTHTALEVHGLGFVVLGEPSNVRELLLNARETGLPCALEADTGLFFVDAGVEWRLTGVCRDE